MWFEAMARLWDLTLRNGVVVRTAMDSDCFRRRKIQVSPSRIAGSNFWEALSLMDLHGRVWGFGIWDFCF